MPPLGYSSAVMAVVAYGEVKGSDGTSTGQNSGHYATSRVAAGHYRLTPRSGDIQSDALSQCIVQVKAPNGDQPLTVTNVSSDATVFTNPLVAPFATGGVPAAQAGTIDVFTFSSDDPSGDATDKDFSFIVLRSTLTPPAGSPA